MHSGGIDVMVLNPKVDSPPFATTAAAAPLQYYQVDPVHQFLGLLQVVFKHSGLLDKLIVYTSLRKIHHPDEI